MYFEYSKDDHQDLQVDVQQIIQGGVEALRGSLVFGLGFQDFKVELFSFRKTQEGVLEVSDQQTFQEHMGAGYSILEVWDERCGG